VGDICFSLHGCSVLFSSPDPEVLAAIAADFAGFHPAGPGSPQVRIEALPEAPPAVRPRQVLGTERWSVLRERPGIRLVWYPQGALVRYDYGAAKGTILSADRELLRELSYLLILSRAGEWLDRRGLHRLHGGALAFGGNALLFFGAMGAGKTTLLLELLKDPSFSLLSDDTPVIGAAGLVYPFHARIGLGEGSPHLSRFPGAAPLRRRHFPPKRVIPAAAAGRLCPDPAKAGPAFILSRGTSPRLTRCAAGRAAGELLLALVAGWGVPQLAEYFLRPSPADAAAKARILASRLGAAGRLLHSSDFWIFETGPDPALNADALRSFLRNSSGLGSAA
jgi:hypothetical protein